MSNRLCEFVSDYCPVRIINDNGPYLERYYLFSFLGYTFYLHKFVNSDPDRGLHDHPWYKSFSIVLSGSYIEKKLKKENNNLLIKITKKISRYVNRMKELISL